MEEISSKIIILTKKEIEALYMFLKENSNSTIIEDTVNIVVKAVSNNVGSQIFIQTQEDYCKNKENWKDITDYNAW